MTRRETPLLTATLYCILPRPLYSAPIMDPQSFPHHQPPAPLTAISCFLFGHRRQTRRLAPHVFASARTRKGAEERVRFRVQAIIQLIAAVKCNPRFGLEEQSRSARYQTCMPSLEKETLCSVQRFSASVGTVCSEQPVRLELG